MTYHSAIIVDDLAADRQLAAHALRQFGWAVQVARNSAEASILLAKVVASTLAPNTIILTDLHMPNDPIHRTATGNQRAGSSYALALRARMELGEIPRMPIIALTALTEHEAHLTAIAFGCDAVLLKPATSDLSTRITAALNDAANELTDTIGANAILSLLRQRLAAELLGNSTKIISEHDITKALLAYRRYGTVGLGQSLLSVWLVPGTYSPYDAVKLHFRFCCNTSITYMSTTRAKRFGF